MAENIIKINNNEHRGDIINELQPSPVSVSFLSTSNITNADFILNWKCIQCCSVIKITGSNFTGFNQLYIASDTMINNRPYYVGLNEIYAISFGTHWTVGNITSNNVQQNIISDVSSENRSLSYIRNNHTKPCPGEDNQWEEIINSDRNKQLIVDCHCKYTNKLSECKYNYI